MGLNGADEGVGGGLGGTDEAADLEINVWLICGAFGEKGRGLGVLVNEKSHLSRCNSP